MNKRFTVRTGHSSQPVYSKVDDGSREFTGTATRNFVSLYDRGSEVAAFVNVSDVALADRIAKLLNDDESYRQDDAYRNKLQEQRNQQ